ncbi:hypothetical protein FEZ60_04260 [Rhodococcus sp. MS16]|nr:hypothetical protein [Rhodococcus sp. MS16]
MSMGRSGSDSDSLIVPLYQYLSLTETPNFPNICRQFYPNQRPQFTKSPHFSNPNDHKIIDGGG